MDEATSEEVGNVSGKILNSRPLAFVKLNSALQPLSGAIDGYVYKHYSYGVVVTRMPRMDRIKPWSAQLVQRARFRDAAKYHRAVQRGAGEPDGEEALRQTLAKERSAAIGGDHDGIHETAPPPSREQIKRGGRK